MYPMLALTIHDLDSDLVCYFDLAMIGPLDRVARWIMTRNGGAYHLRFREQWG